MRWHYRDPLLAWLFPVSYAFHLLEEWFGGFPEWLAVIGGRPLPRAAFVAINLIAFTGVLLATRAAIRREEHGWLAISIATLVLVNGLAHIFGSLATRTYSPGLFTAVILYLPLGQLSLLRAWSQADRDRFIRGVGAGVTINAAVFVLALSVSALAR